MTATPGLKGFGSSVYWNNTKIGYARDIPIPNMSRGDIDFFNQESPSEAKEYVSGSLEPGECSWEMLCIVTDAGQIAALADFFSGVTHTLEIRSPSAGAFIWSCDAYVKGWSGNLPNDGEVVTNITMKLSGLPTLGVTYAGDLTALTITTATLLPSLTASLYAYTATTTGTSVTVTPTYATATSIEVWAGTSIITLALVSVLASGGTSSSIAISGVGTNVSIQIKVKKTGYATRIYNVTLVKTA